MQTAEGALDEVGAMLNRQRDLVIQARNGTQDSNSIAAIQAEFDALSGAIADVGSDTKFAGKTVFSATAVNFQVGNADGDQITVTTGVVGHTASGSTVTDAGVLGALDTDIANISTTCGSLGATQNRLESTVRNLSVTSENLAAAESRIRDVDVAEEMMSFTRSHRSCSRPAPQCWRKPTVCRSQRHCSAEAIRLLPAPSAPNQTSIFVLATPSWHG